MNARRIVLSWAAQGNLSVSLVLLIEIGCVGSHASVE